MASVLSADRRPGTRWLVEYPEDPGWAHERFLLWPCAGGAGGVSSGIYLTPDGDLYEELDADYSRMETFTESYPAWADELDVRQFDTPVEKPDLEHHMNIARREVQRVLAGRQRAPPVYKLVDWGGHTYPLPRVGILQAGRDALAGHRPVVAGAGAGRPRRRHNSKGPALPAPEERPAPRVPPPGAGVGDVDDEPPMAPPRDGPGTGVAPGKILASGESAEIADCVWMVIYRTTVAPTSARR